MALLNRHFIEFTRTIESCFGSLTFDSHRMGVKYYLDNEKWVGGFEWQSWIINACKVSILVINITVDQLDRLPIVLDQMPDVLNTVCKVLNCKAEYIDTTIKTHRPQSYIFSFENLSNNKSQIKIIFTIGDPESKYEDCWQSDEEAQH